VKCDSVIGDELERVDHALSVVYNYDIAELEVSAESSSPMPNSFLLFGGMDLNGLYNTTFMLQEQNHS
jgi:hypothetical protein